MARPQPCRVFFRTLKTEQSVAVVGVDTLSRCSSGISCPQGTSSRRFSWGILLFCKNSSVPELPAVPGIAHIERSPRREHGNRGVFVCSSFFPRTNECRRGLSGAKRRRRPRHPPGAFTQKNSHSFLFVLIIYS